MRVHVWKVLIGLGVLLGMGFALRSLLFKPGSFSTSELRPEPSPPIAGSSTQEPERSGLPPCFFLQGVPSATKKPTVGDCLLLVPGQSEVDTFEVNLRTGLFVLAKTDLFLPDTLPIVFTRTFRSRASWFNVWEIPAAHVYDVYPTGSRYPYTYIDLHLPDGQSFHYGRISPGTSYADAIYEHTSTHTLLQGSRIKWNGNGWDLTLKDGTVYLFPKAYYAARPAPAALVGMRDRRGQVLTLTRDRGGNPVKITSPNHQWLELSGASSSITQLRDDQGRVVKYEYDAYGRLSKVIRFDGLTAEYSYDEFNRLLTVKGPRGIVVLRNEYDPNGRVIKQTQADASSYRFRYVMNEYGNILQTDVIDPRGNVTRLTFSGNSYTVTAVPGRTSSR